MKRLHDPNLDLRLIARSRNVSHTELAQHLKITPERLARWMSREMSSKLNNRVLSAIIEVEQEEKRKENEKT